MFGTYFYNKNIRNIVILFGTVFNDISVRRVNSSNVVQEEFKVPIAYGPSEKFLVRLRQATDISKGKVGLTLPRMSFEFTSITYDPARKLQTTKRHKAIKSLGIVEGINLVSGGSGYTGVPTVTFSGGGGTTQATATATILDGVVTGFTSLTGGAGYTSTPIIKIADIVGGGGSGAAAAVIRVGNTVGAVLITANGSGYTSVPTITFSGGGGTGAAGTAVVANQTVTAVNITAAGSGYTSDPTVVFNVSSGGGSGATATANLDVNTTTFASVYNPVPYNFDFTLSIMVKNSDDGTQILEQILPYFTPDYHVTMNEMKELGIKRDIPIIFTGLSTEDSYEGDYLTRRALIHTLTFVVQAFLYGPTTDMGIIRTVDVNKYNATTATTRLLSNTEITPDPLTADLDDDYGFTITITE